jgi:hypothetical protein
MEYAHCCEKRQQKYEYRGFVVEESGKSEDEKEMHAKIIVDNGEMPFKIHSRKKPPAKYEHDTQCDTGIDE